MILRAALAFALLWTGAAWAQALAIDERGGVRFVSGGVGVEERVLLDRLRPRFSLQLAFAAARGGNYLAGVEVAALNAAGRAVWRGESDGPWLFANLAPGSYKLRARFGGKTQTREVEIRRGWRTEVFLYWADPTALNLKDLRD
jgi:hypothetical protein